MPLKSLPIVRCPFDLESADFVGPLPKTTAGNRYLLTITDHATKDFKAIALPADAENAKQAFLEVFSHHGLQRQLLCDSGNTFIIERFSTFLDELRIQPLLNSAYHPESNGTIEP